MILVILNFSTLQAQSTTYSKYEEDMILYANNGWMYADKYDSIELAEKALDSCWQFVRAFPNSFAKPNVLSMMLEMTITLTDDLNKIYPLIDSVLSYDKLPSTRLRMGEILIERNLDLQKGREYVIDAFSLLSVEFHKYRAYMLMARSDITFGQLFFCTN